MRRTSLRLVLAAALALPAAAVGAAEFTDAQRRAIEAVVEDYLARNPEAVERALHALEERREAEEARAAAEAIETHARELFDSPAIPVGGNPEGDVTIVEFFDYRCGVCRRVFPVIAELVASDGGIRLVYKEWPILGPDSVFASRAALAARAQGKYAAFHDALMKRRGALGRAEVLDAAAAVGLAADRLQRDMEAPEIEEVLARTYAIAEALGIDGTPSFLIGRRLLQGGRDLATMKRLVAEARAAAR